MERFIMKWNISRRWFACFSDWLEGANSPLRQSQTDGQSDRFGGAPVGCRCRGRRGRSHPLWPAWLLTTEYCRFTASPARCNNVSFPTGYGPGSCLTHRWTRAVIWRRTPHRLPLITYKPDGYVTNHDPWPFGAELFVQGVKREHNRVIKTSGAPIGAGRPGVCESRGA